MQLHYVLTKFERIQLLSEKIQSILMFPMFLLILIGAIGQWKGKRNSLVLYYIQFPFRLYLWIFTVGFITLLPEAFGSFEDFWFGLLLKVCFTVEIIRLFLSIQFHRKLIQSS